MSSQPLALDSSYGPLLILCDWAEVINGKLYIMGAGWSRVPANRQIGAAVAVMWKIPWAHANEPQAISLRLVTDDGQPVNGPDDKPIMMEGSIEAGRPPGIKFGSPLDAPIAAILQLNLKPGRYRFEFTVSRELAAQVSFDAVTP